jgi:hypothetical protein
LFPVCTRPQSTHMHCFVHCRFTAAQVQHGLGAAWSGGYDALFPACTRPTHAHVRFIHCRSHCSSVQHSLGAAWSVRPRSLFQHAHRLHPDIALLSPPADCSSVQQAGACLEHYGGYDVRCSSPTAPTTPCIACPPQTSAAQSWCCSEREWLRDARCFSTTSPPSAHVHAQSTAD